MSLIIIRLQNLPWSANSYDIRQFFSGLSIPEGGVHIVGGEKGDAFISFSTDEDARQAMMRNGGKIKEVQVSLSLSSRNEMKQVIEALRSATSQPVIPQQSQEPSSQSTASSIQTITITDSDDGRARKRSRSRSSDRYDRDRFTSGRRDTRDVSRRHRSRSRSWDRDRRRRNRSRSRSRDRNSYDSRNRRDVKEESSSKHRDPRVKPGENTTSGSFYGQQVPVTLPNASQNQHPLSAINSPLNNFPNEKLHSPALPVSSQSNVFPNINSSANPIVAPALADLILKSQSGLLTNNVPNASGVWLTPPPATAIANVAAAVLSGLGLQIPSNAKPTDDEIRAKFMAQVEEKDTNWPKNDRPGLLPRPRLDSSREHRDPRVRDFDGREERPIMEPRGRCIELLGKDSVPFREVRKAFSSLGFHIDEIRYAESMGRRRIGVKLFEPERKNEILRIGEVFILDSLRRVVDLRDEDFENFNGKPAFQGERFRHRSGDYNDGNYRSRRDDHRYDPSRYKNDRTRSSRYHDSRFRENDYSLGKREEKEGGGGEVQVEENDYSVAQSEQEEKNEYYEEEGEGQGHEESNNGGELPEFEVENSYCVFMSNLPKGTTDRDLYDFFSDTGLTPKKVNLVLDDKGESTNEAYVEFWSREQAQVAVTKDQAPLGRKNVKVELVSRKSMNETFGINEEIAPKNAEPVHVKKIAPLLGPGAPPIRPPPFMPRFPRPRGPLMRAPPDPYCVVTMYNIPYRAGTDEILDFFASEFHINPAAVFRKLNERGQPTSEARIAMNSREDALRAVEVLQNKVIRDRPIQLGLLRECD